MWPSQIKEVAMRSLRILFAALVLVSLLLVGQSQSALAAPPEFDFVDLVFVFPVSGCEFPVEAVLTATLKVSMHFNKDGELWMIIDRVRGSGQSTYTNLETGASIRSTHGAGIDRILFEEDGSVIFITMGIFDILPAPGQGLIVHDTGRIMVHATTGELLFSAGQFTVHGLGGNVEALCAALE